MVRNSLNIADFGVNVSDNDGNLRNIDEIIADLQNLYDNYDTHSMNDHMLYLQGEKNMLGEIIKYLKRL